jgi:phosphoribosylanthranilate isomerase
MSVEVKICGINSVEAADAALAARADFAGLVFHPRSPRRVTLEQAVSLGTRLKERTRVVALLVDPSDEEAAIAVRAVAPQLLQLHGKETAERVAALRTRFGIPVMKVIAVADASDLSIVPAYEKVADRLMFDAKPPSGATREGGHGAAFDWQLLRGRKFARPWLLAGGLTPDNVARAIQTAEAPGVDVSSGVETAPGVKNAELIAAFAKNARAASHAEVKA